MTNDKLSSVLVLRLLIATFWMLLPVMAGRALGAEQSGTAAQIRMEAARDEVANVRSNILLTLVELDRVRGERGPVRPHFTAFTNQLAAMEVVVKAFAKHAEEMKQRGNAYFADWEAKTAAMQSPEARQSADQRMADRKRSYEAIIRSMQDARQNFLSFYEDVTNVKTLLAGEPDQKSIAQAKDLFMHANWRSIDTQRALMNMEEEFDRLADSFAKDSTTGGGR